MRIKKFLPFLAILLLIVPLFVHAAALTKGDITDFANDIAGWLYIIGFAIALIVIIVGGISYMTAGGNEEQEKKAKQTIVKGLIGAAIILVAGVILDTLENIIGTSLPT